MVIHEFIADIAGSIGGHRYFHEFVDHIAHHVRESVKTAFHASGHRDIVLDYFIGFGVDNAKLCVVGQIPSRAFRSGPSAFVVTEIDMACVVAVDRNPCVFVVDEFDLAVLVVDGNAFIVDSKVKFTVDANAAARCAASGIKALSGRSAVPFEREVCGIDYFVSVARVLSLYDIHGCRQNSERCEE